MKREPKITGDELLAAVEEARQAVNTNVLSSRPPGAFTVFEYIGDSGTPRQTASEQLNKLVRNGIYEQFMVSIIDKQGKRRAVAMYRKKK